MPHEPEVTIVLPNYNHAECVGRAIRGVRNQRQRPARLIVVDDGSSDQSRSVIQQALDGAHDVTLLANDTNRGVEYSMAKAFAHVTTPFICAISASDELLPEFLSELAPWLESHPKSGLFLSDFAFRRSGRSGAFPKHIGLSSSPGYLGPKQITARLHRSGFILPAYGAVFRRDALEDAGGFRPQLRWHSDWFAELVLAFRHGVCYVPKVLALAELDSNGYSSGADDPEAQLEVLEQILALLEHPAYADVRASFIESRALAYFGRQILTAVRQSSSSKLQRSDLPWAGIARQELKKFLIRAGSHSLREAYWRLRYHSHQLPAE